MGFLSNKIWVRIFLGHPSLHLDSEYGILWISLGILVLIAIYFQNSTSMVNEGFWISLEVANAPANHLRSAARAIDYVHRALDVITEVDATSAICTFSRMRREGQLYNYHEAFINEIAMYAELGRARPRWGADKHEWLR